MARIGFTEYRYFSFKVEIRINDETLIFVNNNKLHHQSLTGEIVDLLKSGDEEKAITGILKYQEKMQQHVDRIYQCLP